MRADVQMCTRYVIVHGSMFCFVRRFEMSIFEYLLEFSHNFHQVVVDLSSDLRRRTISRPPPPGLPAASNTGGRCSGGMGAPIAVMAVSCAGWRHKNDNCVSQATDSICVWAAASELLKCCGNIPGYQPIVRACP